MYIEKKFAFVYITTNLINGKQYVGDHCTDVIEDGYLGSAPRTLHPAIKKYGKQNFKREILEFFPTKKEAFESQEKYINEYNTLTPNGYNISPKGGSQCVGGASLETRKLMSMARKGKKPWNDGIPHSEESKKLMSKTKKEKKSGVGIKNNMFGKEPFDVWVKKYGIEEAEKRKKDLYEKRSKNLKKIECEHCHRIIPLNIYKRCHGPKCKPEYNIK